MGTSEGSEGLLRFRDLDDRILRELWLVGLPSSLRRRTQVGELSMHHRDPFDRMLVAQARSENMMIVTRESMITAYDVRTLW